MKIAKQIIECFKGGHKLLICGNGGSATMASHFSGELVGRYKHSRMALPALSLFDLAYTTAIANDMGYENVFMRPLEAFGRVGDILITLSTSGKSENVLRAIKYAHDNDIEVIDWPRRGKDISSIQEYQLKLIHKVCELVEKEFL